MSETAAVLFANEAFYAAFSHRDALAMEEIWAEGVPVSCIHPGWGLIDDREGIMESWRSILGNENSPPVTASDPEVTFYGDVALVVCYEIAGETDLIATNIFTLRAGRWLMVHHQAGPLAFALEEEEAYDEEDEGEPPATLH